MLQGTNKLHCGTVSTGLVKGTFTNTQQEKSSSYIRCCDKLDRGVYVIRGKCFLHRSMGLHAASASQLQKKKKKKELEYESLSL